MAALELTRAELDLLDDWIAMAETRDFVDGEWDCLMAPCDWARVLTGEDPGAPWRGTYCSALAAAAIVRAGGGLQKLVGRTLEAAGWERTRRPTSGAFGVVIIPPARAIAFGAVRYGTRWALPTAEGLMIAQARQVAAWAAPARSRKGAAA